MKIDVPAFRLVDGDKDIKSFDGFNQLVSYCNAEGREELKELVLGNAALIMLFDHFPLKYDLSNKRLYVLTWKEANNIHKMEEKNATDQGIH